MQPRRQRSAIRHPTTFDTVRHIVAMLPGCEEGTSYGTPAFRVAGKLFARLREEGDVLVLRADFDTRDALIAANPEVFYTTDHYRGHPWVLVRFTKLQPGELRALLEEAWRSRAPKSLQSSYRGGE